MIFRGRLEAARRIYNYKFTLEGDILLPMLGLGGCNVFSPLFFRERPFGPRFYNLSKFLRFGKIVPLDLPSYEEVKSEGGYPNLLV